MNSLNLVQLIGNVTRDPEVKVLTSGEKLCTCSVATNREWKDKTTGEKKKEADFHNLVIWGGLAEVFEKYVHKGDPLYISGELRTRSYDDKDGKKQYRTEINVKNMSMLGSRGASQGAEEPAVDPNAEVRAEDLPF